MYSVTILLASHNRLGFLKEALESALAQDYPEFEVLIVDDGSDEKTHDWLTEVAARWDRVRVILQPHQGVAAARSTGVREARTDLICVLDSDDKLVPGALTRIVSKFNEHLDLDLAYGNICHSLPYNSYRNRAYPRFRSNRAMTFGVFLFPRIPFKHSGTTYRREVALDLGDYDVTLPCKVDIDLFLKFLTHGKKLELIDGDPLVLFRVHSESLSRNRALGLKAWFRLIDRYGPQSPLLRWGIKIWRTGSEMMKALYEKVRVG